MAIVIFVLLVVTPVFGPFFPSSSSLYCVFNWRKRRSINYGVSYFSMFDFTVEVITNIVFEHQMDGRVNIRQRRAKSIYCSRHEHSLMCASLPFFLLIRSHADNMDLHRYVLCMDTIGLVPASSPTEWFVPLPLTFTDELLY